MIGSTLIGVACKVDGINNFILKEQCYTKKIGKKQYKKEEIKYKPALYTSFSAVLYIRTILENDFINIKILNSK